MHFRLLARDRSLSDKFTLVAKGTYGAIRKEGMLLRDCVDDLVVEKILDDKTVKHQWHHYKVFGGSKDFWRLENFDGVVEEM